MWNGIQILPGNTPGDRYGSDLLRHHVERAKIDLVITLSDIWVIEPAHLKGLPVAHWMPVDCTPLSSADQICLEHSGAIPVAMSRFGQKMLTEAGFDALYVPHGIDLGTWKPSETRDQTRQMLGAEGKFVIGINAANKDSFRKGMFEQLSAFAALHRRHPDTVMLVHGLVQEPGALNLEAMIDRLGLRGDVRFVDQYEYLTGQIPEAHLVNWYSALDLYTACSFGEGFGLTIAESIACGTPCVVTDASAMPEVMGGAGWKVPGEPFWNPVHNAKWVKPNIGAIVKAYEKAYQRGPEYKAKQAACARAALAFDADKVLTEFWKPALDELAVRTGAA